MKLSERWLTALRWVLIVVGLLGVALGLAKPWSAQLLYLLPYLTFATVGWLLTTRRPENAEGWLFLGSWGLFGLFGLADFAVARAVETGNLTSWWGWTGAWMTNWIWPLLLVMSTTLPLLVFPSGFASVRWRWVGVATVVFAGFAALCGIVSPVLQFQTPAMTVANPLAPGFLADAGPSDDWLLRNLALLGVAVTAVLAATSVVVRARRARGVEKVQFRWVAFAVALLAIMLVLLTLPWLADTTLLGTLGWAVALSLLPAAVGVAILRFRLYEIDRIISRTTSYVLVTGILLLVYVVVVWTVPQLLPESGALAVAAATLCAAALFRPLLSRVRSAVDHRFNRARYDAEHTVDAFASRLRDEVDPDVVTKDLLQVVETTVVPEHTSLWLRAR